MEENDRHYDVRVIEKHLERGTISRAQYEAWLQGLPDDAEKGVATDTRMTSLRDEQDAASDAS